MSMKPAILAAALLAAAFIVPAGAQAPPEAEQCATCHGAEGRSETPNVPSLAGMPAEFITLQMILFREGLRDAPPMPQFAQGLSDAQIEQIAAFYASLPPGPAPDRGPRDAALAERGAALSARMHCGVCHLPDFRGRAQMPRLAGQREDFLAQTLKEYRDNRRVGTDTQMNAVMYGVSDADIAALAHFLAQRD
ncbi:c-type cytochrome [Roseomonas hellenica]|nr:c-type cytochrome [Plastoroseomonas hellenica]